MYMRIVRRCSKRHDVAVKAAQQQHAADDAVRYRHEQVFAILCGQSGSWTLPRQRTLSPD